jgi:hypothetical protein
LIILVLAGPYVAVQVICCNLWDQLDQKTVSVVGLVKRMSARLAPHTAFLMKNPKDGFIANSLILLGICLPAYFFYELYLAVTVGFSFWRVLVYNIIRIGPMYINFMNVYVLCHKEAHNFGTLFAKPRFFKYIFNLWVGMFHGVLPGTFTYSHIYNHHRYDNDARDVYSTAFRPRDQFKSWVKYLPEWFGYASNVSSIKAFIQEGRWNWVQGITLSTLYYVAFVSACYWVAPLFTVFTLVYAFVEGNPVEHRQLGVALLHRPGRSLQRLCQLNHSW